MHHRTQTSGQGRSQARRKSEDAFRSLLLEAYWERVTLLRRTLPADHGSAGHAAAEYAPSGRAPVGRAPAVAPSSAPPRHPSPAKTPRHQLELPRVDAGPRLPQSGRLLPPPQAASATTEASPAQTAIQSAARLAMKLPAVAARDVVEAFAPSRQQDTNHDAAMRRLWTRGLTYISAFVAILLVWGMASGISSAVIAAGQFVVDGSVKKVQHPTGGVVAELLVREGDRVSEGDLLIRLDETITRTNFQVVANQIDELTARKARLEAERDGRETFEMPRALTARQANREVAQIVATEQKLFEARRAARTSQRAQLSKRISQLQNEIVGLRAQLDANAREAKIISSELEGVRDLFKKNLTPIMRLNALERQAVNLDGQRGQLSSQIAQSEGKIAEIELQILQINEDLRAEAQKELRDVQTRIAELTERRVAAEDQVKRVELRAPTSGHVHQLAVHTVGGVITPAEPVMLIVPAQGELIVEAKVMPQDRDRLQPGQDARVRVHSSHQRTTPELNGKLLRVSADISRDPATSAPFYTIRVRIPQEELMRLRDVNITSGMQADVYVETGSRTPLQYLLQPLSDQIMRAFREH